MVPEQVDDVQVLHSAGICIPAVSATESFCSSHSESKDTTDTSCIQCRKDNQRESTEHSLSSMVKEFFKLLNTNNIFILNINLKF